MRINFLTELTNNTRCRIYNDSTSYMATSYFETHLDRDFEHTLRPLGFEVVDNVTFKLGYDSYVNSFLYERNGIYMVFVKDSDTYKYKMFKTEDFEFIKSEIEIKSVMMNKIVDTPSFEVNYSNKEDLIVFDDSDGLLANKTPDEIREFFTQNGDKTKEFCKINGVLKVVDIEQTLYYYKIDNYVFNKRLDIQSYLMERINLSDYVEREYVGITISNEEEVKVSTNKKSLSYRGKTIILDANYNFETEVSGYYYVIKEEHLETFSEEVKTCVEERIKTEHYNFSFAHTISQLKEKEKEKDIFYLFKI